MSTVTVTFVLTTFKTVWTQFWVQKKIGPKKFWVEKVWFKIGSVTAEILLIMTNVVRLHVTWTNFTMTVDICYRWSQKADFEVWSKSGL